jgi:hypothetical protein
LNFRSPIRQKLLILYRRRGFGHHISIVNSQNLRLYRPPS